MVYSFAKCVGLDSVIKLGSGTLLSLTTKSLTVLWFWYFFCIVDTGMSFLSISWALSHHSYEFDLVRFGWAALWRSGRDSSPVLIYVITRLTQLSPYNSRHDKWLYVNPHPPGIKFKFVLGLHDYCVSY